MSHEIDEKEFLDTIRGDADENSETDSEKE
jgi:hypothetical protein